MNVQNKTNLCFLWSILAHQHPFDNHPERVNKYEKYIITLKYDGIEMPMAVGDFDRFEKLNKDLTINVYGYEEGLIFLRRISNRREGKIINLIMFDNSNGGHHYALIKNLDRLLGSGRDLSLIHISEPTRRS